MAILYSNSEFSNYVLFFYYKYNFEVDILYSRKTELHRILDWIIRNVQFLYFKFYEPYI